LRGKVAIDVDSVGVAKQATRSAVRVQVFQEAHSHLTCDCGASHQRAKLSEWTKSGRFTVNTTYDINAQGAVSEHFNLQRSTFNGTAYSITNSCAVLARKIHKISDGC
jgi:hypothetical protein